MSRDYAAIYTSVWGDPDWRRLTVEQQHTYLMLLSQPKLSPCGVLDYLPTRLAGMTHDLTTAAVDDAVQELATARPRPWLIVDEGTSELVLRSFVRWDQLIPRGRPAKAVAKDYRMIVSPLIRGVVMSELRRLHRQSPGLSGWKHIEDLDPTLFEEVKNAPLKAVS